MHTHTYIKLKMPSGANTCIWVSQTRDQQYPVNVAVFAFWMQDGAICRWGSVCGHLSDARWNEGWFFPIAPHRVQSHYRPCQIQLVTEFAAQEKGEKQDWEGWGMGIKWISWRENSRGPVLIIKNKERAFFTVKCTSEFAEDGQFYLLAWTMIMLAYFRESTEVKSFTLNERLDFRNNSLGRHSFLFHICLS